MHRRSVLDFGALGDGVSDDAVAIQGVIDLLHEEGGGTIVFPSDYQFLSGPLELRSNVGIYLEPGSKLIAHPDSKKYKLSAFKDNQAEGTMWLHAKDCTNIFFDGQGIIDGNGVAFMGKELDDSFALKPFDTIDPRPHLLTLIGCSNISIKHVRFKDAAYWGIHLVGCHGVVIDRVIICNNRKIRNGDGIDINHSSNVIITACSIESGDDSICFKNRREYSEYGACEDIIVANCTLVSASCAIKFGSENVDTIKNVVISNCVIKDSNRGIGLQNRDEGNIYNVIFFNITMNTRLYSDVWWGKAEPIYITAFNRDNINHKDARTRLPEGKTAGSVGEIRDIHFQNIICNSENGIFICADDSDLISNVSFTEVRLHLNKITEKTGGIYDCRPRRGADFISEGTFGWYIRKAGDVLLNSCHVFWGENIPAYFRSKLNIAECTNFQAKQSNVLEEDEAYAYRDELKNA